jgi:hypothetical protein
MLPSLEASTAWSQGYDEVMHADGTRAVGQEALAGTTLIVCVRHPDPLQNLPGFNHVLEIGSMPGHEPKRQGVFQASCARMDPVGNAVGKRTGRAADKLAVVGECQLLDRRRPQGRRDDRSPSEDAQKGETVETIEDKAPTLPVADRPAQLWPCVERADSEAKVWPLSQGIARLKGKAKSQMHPTQCHCFDLDQ